MLSLVTFGLLACSARGAHETYIHDLNKLLRAFLTAMGISGGFPISFIACSVTSI